ncbi:MAG TPA: FtsX-like permease family protein [Streptosporangiaceae bacterium]|nr:FtsX-like permease family protein [Streptosporangiaceae bacterium]
MSTATRERPAEAGAANGGVPARRAVIRWSGRMFRREWRQQMLVLALIVVALAATVVGAAVATNTPPPAGAGFGTAQEMATLPGGPHLAGQIGVLQQAVGRVDVIENQAVAIPGSINTYDLRAQDPRGPFGQPMLSLVSGHYPAGPGQVAVTQDVATTFSLKVGDVWHQGGQVRQVTGIVQNPQSLLDEFALVAPGQVSQPSQVTVLFTAPRGKNPASIGSVSQYVVTRQDAAASNPLNPKTIVLALATVGMLLIALVAVGGFTVVAQRRLRSLGMLGALGATDRNIRLVVRVNGVLVGIVGAVIGTVLGLAVWLAYRPELQSSAHHLIGPFQLPWVVIGPAIALAVVATYFAASRPARAITRIPIVAALSGRPAPPKQVHRSALPGVILFVIAAALLSFSGSSNGNGGGALELILGIVLLVAAIILLAPLCLVILGRLGRRAPIALRLALRDLSRYRARSGSALSAISLGVFIAALVCILTAQRYGNVLDYAGPNMASNQIIVYTPGHGGGPGGGGPNGGPGGSSPSATASTPQAQAAVAQNIARALGSNTVIELDHAGASLQHAAAGRSWSGPVFVATPQLLAAFGIKASEVNPHADILTMRPGLSGLSQMQLVYGNDQGGGPGGGGHGPQDVGSNSWPCPKGQCLANPVIQQVGALPSGTSGPNTVITEHAIHTLGLHTSVGGWLIQAPHPPTAVQITDARLTAGAAGMTIETKSSTPSSAEILNYATAFGIALALGILAMTIGLIRSETARDLRTLTATGASSFTRRELTAATAFALALAGAVLGTVAAYVAAVGYAWDNPLDGLSGLSSVPGRQLLFICVGMPVVAAVVGWLLAGREPSVISRQPLE